MTAGQTFAPIPLAAEEPPAGTTVVEHLLALARRYGPIFQVPQPGPRSLIVANFALADAVCDDQTFDKVGSPDGAAIRLLAGDGLFTARTPEPNWHKAHNILLPNFSMQAMKNYLPDMLDLAEQLVLKWTRLNADDDIDVLGDMTRLPLDTIGLCGFGYRFNSFYREDMHPFVASLNRVLTALQQASQGEALLDVEIEHPSQQLQDDLASMNAFVDTLIQERKAAGPDAAAQHDLLGYMLTGVDRQTGQRLDDRNIRYQVMTFMIAGHETTSSLLTWTLYYLVKHPEVLARAYDEIDRVLGGDLEAKPTYVQLHELPYISQILQESLRLSPPAIRFTRHPYAETVLANKYRVDPGDYVGVLVPALHRDPAVWGDHAEQFDPEHFSPQAEQALPPNAFKPFGTGQRACIGRSFALQEATLALGMILQRFELVDYANYQLQLKQAGAPKPDHFTIKVRPRTHRATIAPTPEANGHRQPEMTETAPSATTPSISAHNTPLLVLYGSNLGTGEDLAHRIGDGGTAHGFAATVAPLDDYTDKLPTQGAVVVVTSSYNGTPPDNAARFCDWLGGSSLPSDRFKGVRYTVFGCGDKDWTATYQKIPKFVDAQLEAHGAQRIYPRGEGDAHGDFDGQFQAWYAPLWPKLATALGIDVGAAQAVGGPLYALEFVTAATANRYATASGAKPLTITVNRELCALHDGHVGLDGHDGHDGEHPDERSVRHIEVALDEGISYRTGDHLAVLPHNPVPLVERVLARFGIARDAFVRIHRNTPGSTQLPLDQPTPVLGLVARFVELHDVATRGQIKGMADYVASPDEKQQLLALAEDPRYTDEVLAKRLSLIDLLEMFPACALPFNVYLEWLRPLRPRYYSISSSPLADAHTCAITVAVVDAPALSGRGRYEGTCSSYLQLQPSHSAIYAFARSPQMAFRPPEDPAIPIIMVGPGTGIAPFRGFLQERAALQAKGAKLGRALLFFGCRNPDDFLYQDELQAWVDQGVTTLYTAFSRLEGQPKTYVQDEIKAHADDVWQLIQEGAVIYICGDASRMEPDVRKAFIDISQAKTGTSP
ncbi:MAG TPA: cytochrome P450, partial [Ktedonobacterales bacterium]|nr:cytochrome P450 [Ktedonobacterales bacterium]